MQTLGSDEEKRRFNREAQAAAALSHAHFAHIYGIDKVDGQLFIAMEYIEVQELRKMIANLAKVLNPRKVLDIATQIAAGLQTAHEKGVVHRHLITGCDSVRNNFRATAV